MTAVILPAPRSGENRIVDRTSTPTVPWKTVALPVEHGGWGLLAEPVALGLVMAPSTAGVLLGLAALAAFLARHPLRLVLLDRRKRARYPRTAWAERFLAGYAGVALLLLATAFALSPRPFWPALAAAAPIGLVALAFDVLGRSREAAAEAAGATALSASTTAIALAGGAPAGLAWGAWLLLALRAVTSVLYVRARIRLDRGLAADPRSVLAGHLTALAAAAGLAASARAPWLASAAFLVLLARALWGLSPWRGRVRPQALGYQELGYGLLTLVLLAVGYRVGP